MTSISNLSLEILHDASIGYTKIHENSIKKVYAFVSETVISL